MAGSRLYPAGSTSRMRADTLVVLGVLKVATAGQVQRLVRPTARDNKGVRAALLDLARHGLTRSEGSTAAGHKLWGLTPAGLSAAAEVLPTGTMLGGTARGAGRSGAPHAMAVNETVIALLRPHADLGQGDTAGLDAGLAEAGIGSLLSVLTEATHHLPAAGRNRAAVRADVVLHAPEAGLPVLLVEVDRGTESPALVAAKFEAYHRFFRLTAGTDRAGKGGRPVWRTLYPATGRAGHPPIAIVYTGRPGPAAIRNRMAAVEELTRLHWQGRWFEDADDLAGGWADYTDAIPILAATLADLQAHGPYGPVWLRHGHRPGQQLVADRLEALADALADPYDRAAYDGRRAERTRIRDQRRAREEAERQAREEERRAWEAAEYEATQARLVASWTPTPPEPPPPPCQRCRGPLVHRDDQDWGVPKPDGSHCIACREELARPWLARLLSPRWPLRRRST